MTSNFERVAGPFPGALGGVTWDGEGVLLSLIDEMTIKKFHPATGAVSDYRLYTSHMRHTPASSMRARRAGAA